MNYDYVIAGGGSAGCALAARLAENPNISVCIVEAGGKGRELFIKMPAANGFVFGNPKLDWGYSTIPQKSLNNRSIFLARGKALGGTSIVNGMMYIRGVPTDYDNWKQIGLSGWGYADLLPYFKRAETAKHRSGAYHGATGPLKVEESVNFGEIDKAFIEAAISAGHKHLDDFNACDRTGVGRSDSTIKRGVRQSSAIAYLQKRPKNLKVLTRRHIAKILFDQKRVVGIETTNGEIIKANREVIVCQGAFGTPHLLMLSGLGPADHLISHGINPIVNLPGVGQSLQDHATVILQYACKKSFPIHKVDQPHRKLAAGIQWVFTRKGMATSNIWEAGGLIKSDSNAEYPDIQYHFGPVGFEFNGTKISLLQAFAIHVDQLRPRSRGQVLLKSSNPYDKPLMAFNYLQDPQDLKEIVNGFKKARQLISQPAFDEYRGVELKPGPDVKSDAEIEHWVRNVAETDYHPSCTCSMGQGKMAVVDDQLKVHGIEKLRVIDASVMPQIVSGNLNAPTQMIASRAADMILGKPQLNPIKAKFAFEN